MSTLCQLFRTSVDRYPANIAVHHRERDWTYAELWDSSAAIATWFREAGLQRGERVALLVPNSAEYVAAYFGILLAGGIAVSLNPDTTPRELVTTIRHCGAVGVVFAQSCVGALEEAAHGLHDVRFLMRSFDADSKNVIAEKPVEAMTTVCRDFARRPIDIESHENDIAQLIYTSGTSGRPKGVTLSHRNLVANCRSIVEYLELSHTDSIFVILPFFYSYGNSLLLTHIAVGGKLIIASDFVFWNRALDLMDEQGATGFSGVPSSFAMLLHKSNFAQRKWEHLRYLTCAGGGLAPAVAQNLQTIAPHVRIFLMYGQTEASARLSTLMPQDLDKKLGSIGKGIPGVTLTVLNEDGQAVEPGEVGEIVAQGNNLMVGYWNDSEETSRVLRADGLHTGDLARIDDEGFIFIVGRQSDIIKSGAYRINPKEIEEIILELPEVAEVAVAGLPDQILGEVPVAFVVPSESGGKVSEADILLHCHRNLPRYKTVRAVHFVGTLPKTSSGKIKRAEFRNWALHASESTLA